MRVVFRGSAPAAQSGPSRRTCQCERPKATSRGEVVAMGTRLSFGEASSVKMLVRLWHWDRAAADAVAATRVTSALTRISPSATGGGRDTRRLATMSAGETHT